MTKRAAVVSAMLLAGLVIAVIGATAALRLVGNSTFGPGGKPLTQGEVRRALAQRSPAAPPGHTSASPATPSHSAGPPAPGSAPAATAASGSFSSTGGTIFATCLSGQVRLASWIPAQGYQTDRYSRGPATSVWVTFKSSATELTVTATCAGSRPHFTSTKDNRGGGRGGGGGRGSSGG
jgi:hypothetical protein